MNGPVVPAGMVDVRMCLSLIGHLGVIEVIAMWIACLLT
jgi:hypothetical protein